VSGPEPPPRLAVMSEAIGVRPQALEHLRIARLLDAHGDVIGAICAYREVVRAGSSAESSEALQRIAALARRD
jgi:hypothetical protein